MYSEAAYILTWYEKFISYSLVSACSTTSVHKYQSTSSQSDIQRSTSEHTNKRSELCSSYFPGAPGGVMVFPID